MTLFQHLIYFQNIEYQVDMVPFPFLSIILIKDIYIFIELYISKIIARAASFRINFYYAITANTLGALNQNTNNQNKKKNSRIE